MIYIYIIFIMQPCRLHTTASNVKKTHPVNLNSSNLLASEAFEVMPEQCGVW